jgi:hypothetical protein
VAGGQFAFQLAGAPDATYFIRASTNLSFWQTISTITLPPSGVAQITNSNPTTFSQRYYRAVRQ